MATTKGNIAAAWFTRVGNVKNESSLGHSGSDTEKRLIWYIRLIGPQVLVKKFNEEDVKHICHACYLLAAKYWHELESWGKEWLINDLKRKLKSLNVRVLAK